MSTASASEALRRLLSALSDVRRSGPGWVARCPAHEDSTPSLSINGGAEGRILIHCHASCPNDRVLAAVGLQFADLYERRERSSVGLAEPPTKSTFLPADAAALWATARARARNDEHIDSDRESYAYLESRRLAEAWEYGCYGVLASDLRLHVAVAHWPRSGYRVLLPLYDRAACVANVQARRVRAGKPKTLFPEGAPVKGTVFADARGLAVLRGSDAERLPVVIGEGLTDHLALTIASPVPLLSIPGTTFAEDAIGPWVRGRLVVLAFDADDAGEKARVITTRRAYEQGAGCVRVVLWSAGVTDACDALQKFGARRLGELLARFVEGGAA